MGSIVFLSIQDVFQIHEYEIEQYGGSPGLRDLRLLESALHAPQAGMGETYFHASLFHMAAAYAFHIAKNHPFIDGNKRTALASALAFLSLNRIQLQDPKEKLYDAIIHLVKASLSKEGFAALLKTLAR